MSKVIAGTAAAVLIVLILLAPGVPVVRALAALLPILIVLALMIAFRWPGQKAGPAGWLAGIVIAALVFGLTLDVLWVSQAKGLVTAGLVLAVLWPALMLYHLVNQAGGIEAVAEALKRVIVDYGLLVIILAWAFGGLLEGLAGYGIPIAIVAPMLVSLGVKPVRAVAAVAVGHAWAVTFGDMGVIFQTLIRVTNAEPAPVAAAAALLLGVCCLACGLAAARILEQPGHTRAVVVLALIMSVTQYGAAVSGLTPLAALLAGLAGMLGGMVIAQIPCLPQRSPLAAFRGLFVRTAGADASAVSRPLTATLASYGALTGLMAAIVLIRPFETALNQLAWPVSLPQVATSQGLVTAANDQVIRPLTHPGTAILLMAIVSYGLYRQGKLLAPGDGRAALRKTWHAAMPATVGILAMVGLSTLMEHTGMTQLLAQGLSQLLGRTFPLVAPLVGILGAFATGSNNNSNVLLAPLQQGVAVLLGIAPAVLLAAQTTGGAIGSMIAPAKIIVGCTTVGLRDQDGDVLRITVPYGLGIGLLVGCLALLLSPA